MQGYDVIFATCFFNRKRKIFDSPNERANYAFVAAGLGVLLVLFVTFCCCCCEGSNFFTDKPRSESLEVRKMREMRNRIEKDNESGMLLTNRTFEKFIIKFQCLLDLLPGEFHRKDHQDDHRNGFLSGKIFILSIIVGCSEIQNSKRTFCQKLRFDQLCFPAISKKEVND